MYTADAYTIHPIKNQQPHEIGALGWYAIPVLNHLRYEKYITNLSILE